MINDNTIISSFNDRPTLLEWLKKVEDALKTDTATGVSVENPSINAYVFKITFADGKTIASDTIQFPDSVKSVTIENGHIIVTTQAGTRTDLVVPNPYADTIVLNSETNTTEIINHLQVDGIAHLGQLNVYDTSRFTVAPYFNGGAHVVSNVDIDGSLQVTGTITTGGNEIKAVVANPTEETTETLTKIKIGNTAYAVGGGTPLYLHKVKKTDGNTISFLSTFVESIKTSTKTGSFPALVLTCSNIEPFKFTTTFSSAPISGYYYINYDADGAGQNTYDLNHTNVENDSVLRFL